MINRTKAALAAILVSAFGGVAAAQTISAQSVITGIANPIWVTHAPNDYSRIFVVEQRQSGGVATTGAVKIYGLPNYNLIGTFVSLTVATGDEQGLLGMAFHPNYAVNGKVYLYYTAGSQDRLAVYTRDVNNPNLLNPTGTVIFSVADPATNHNGGWLKFGPDGYLYLAIGDGGGANDAGTGHIEPTGNGQNLTTTLGKILRFDVDGTNGPTGLYGIPPTNPFANNPDTTIRKEIWAYGIRNAWRNDFDPATGDLYIADVGQNAWEEVNVQPADINGNMGGRNYGWRCFESDVLFNSNGGSCPTYGVGNVPILLKYGHNSSVAPTFRTGFSITGGMVYRGCGIPGLEGTYFFADYVNRWFFSVRANVANNTFSSPLDRTAELTAATGAGITSFGRDAYGELYITNGHNTTNGSVFKIVRGAGAPAPADCNGNSRPDCQEILDGSIADANSNTVPDTCEAPFVSNLSSPANAATGVAVNPTLTWTASSNAVTYNVTVATDAGLTNVVASATGLVGTSWPVTPSLSQGTTYFWGVRGVNPNGNTASNPGTFSFTTITPPPCLGDLNNDGQRNTTDLTNFLGAFGKCPGDSGYTALADLDTANPCINTADLVAFLGVFGVPCP